MHSENPYQVTGVPPFHETSSVVVDSLGLRCIRFGVPTMLCAFANEATVFWGVSDFAYWSQRPYLPTSAILCLLVGFLCVPFIAWLAYLNPLRTFHRHFSIATALLAPCICLFLLLKTRMLPSPEIWIGYYGGATAAVQYIASVRFRPYTGRSKWFAALPSLPCFAMGIAAGVMQIVAHSLSDP